MILNEQWLKDHFNRNYYQGRIFNKENVFVKISTDRDDWGTLIDPLYIVITKE